MRGSLGVIPAERRQAREPGPDSIIIKQQYQTAMRHNPYCLKGAGYAFISLPQQTGEGGGAPRGAPGPRPLARDTARPLAIEDARLSALHRGVLPSGPGTALPCADGGHWPHLIRKASAFLPPRLVQPGLPADPLVGSGGCPEPPGAAADEAATAGAASRSVRRTVSMAILPRSLASSDLS